MAKSNTEPVLYELNLQTLEITVHGVTPLICNRFDGPIQTIIDSL